MSDQERIKELERLLRPFAEAYRLHLRDQLPVSRVKESMSRDTSLEEWRAAYVFFYGEEKVKEPVEET